MKGQRGGIKLATQRPKLALTFILGVNERERQTLHFQCLLLPNILEVGNMKMYSISWDEREMSRNSNVLSIVFIIYVAPLANWQLRAGLRQLFKSYLSCSVFATFSLCNNKLACRSETQKNAFQQSKTEKDTAQDEGQLACSQK